MEATWVESFIRKPAKSILYHLAKAVEHKLLHHPGVFELFGVDLLLDSNLHLWFLEINKEPQLLDYPLKKKFQNVQMIKDMINIQFGILNGRKNSAIKDSGFEKVIN